MKKKIVALCLVICLAATAIVGASLAYFTDTDKAENVFATGHIEIQLLEQQRHEDVMTHEKDPNDLEHFHQNKTHDLFPMIGEITEEGKDSIGMPTNRNFIDKMVNVTVVSEDREDGRAYIRVLYAVPAVAEDAGFIHVQYTDHKSLYRADPVKATLDDGKEYNVYTVYIKKSMKGSQDYSERIIDGVYLNSAVDYKKNAEGEKVYFMGDKEIPAAALENVRIPVFAQAVQAEGFDNYQDAFNAAQLSNNPWVTTPDEIA